MISQCPLTRTYRYHGHKTEWGPGRSKLLSKLLGPAEEIGKSIRTLKGFGHVREMHRERNTKYSECKLGRESTCLLFLVYNFLCERTDF